MPGVHRDGCPSSTVRLNSGRFSTSRSPMADPKLPPDIAAMSFEEALAELEQIVKRLEEGKGKLDEAISSYERGAQLKQHCESKLGEAQGRVDKIVRQGDGSLTAEAAKLD